MLPLPRLTVLLVAALAAPLAGAEGLSPGQKARIQREQQKELEALDKKYGNRKPSELSNSERRALAQERAEAERKVLERNGVTPKDWAVSNMRSGRAEKAEVEAAGKALAAEEESQKKKAADGDEAGASAVKIQRGYGKNKPAVLEDTGSGEPEIEIQRGRPRR